MNLVERVKAILLSPKSEWAVIEGESGEAGFLLTNYVGILVAVPAIASLIGNVTLGWSAGGALLFAIVLYVAYCIAWYIQAYVIDALAPTFGGRKDLASALKVSAYSSTAAWLAGIFQIIPALGILGILGLYSIYLLWTGLPALMKAPANRATGYTAAVVVIMIVVVLVIFLILGAIFGPL